MSDALKNILQFVVEIEKLKSVIRKTRPVGLDRYENSAEHSWHVCLTALMLKDYANESVNIDRVIKMLLLHDLGEIDAGDTIVYQAQTEDRFNEEEAGVKRILAFLPDTMAEEYLALWQEFETGETAEAKYARAIDRVPPLLHNLHSDGHSWRDNNVSKEQVFALNQRIEKGSEALWQEISQRLEAAADEGLLK